MENVAETKKRGRKPKSATPMSGRERTRAYRQQRKRDMVEAIGHESQASTPVLAELLRSEFLLLDRITTNNEDRITNDEKVTMTKNTIARILRELCHRHEIEL
jgi:hypothetical protein